MTFVDPTAGAGAAGTASTTGSSQAGSQAAGLNQLDNSQTFLKLLVAQLKNQNPDNPTDPTSFMTEIAQLTAVQSQTTLNAEEQTVAADSMIGRSVTGNQANGSQVSGVVTGVVLSSSGAPQLQLSGVAGALTGMTPTLSLDAVTRVYTATSAATTPAAGSTASTGATTTGATTTGATTTGSTTTAPTGSATTAGSTTTTGSTGTTTSTPTSTSTSPTTA